MKKPIFILLIIFFSSVIVHGAKYQPKTVQPKVVQFQGSEATDNQTIKFASTAFLKLTYLNKQQLIAGITKEHLLCFFDTAYQFIEAPMDSIVEMLVYKNELYLFQEIIKVKKVIEPVYSSEDGELKETNETVVRYYDQLIGYRLIKYNPNTKATFIFGEMKEIDPEFIFFEFRDSNLLYGKNRWDDTLLEMQLVPWEVKVNPKPEDPVKLGEYSPIYYKNTVLKEDTSLYFLSVYENSYESEVEYFLMRYSYNLKKITDTIPLGAETKFHKVNDKMFIDYMLSDAVGFDEFDEEYYLTISSFKLKQISNGQLLELADILELSDNNVIAKQINATLLIDSKLIMNVQDVNNETVTYLYNLKTKILIRI